RIDESIREFRRVLASDETNVHAWSNLLLTLQYSQDVGPEELYAEHQRYGARFAKPYVAPRAEPLGGRRLRIGYLSPDFRFHVVACFIEPILENHDRGRFEVFCYHNHRVEDQVTERLRGFAEHWVDCVYQSDEELAQRIREDRIDILVDLTGHTMDNRLSVFAMKPAPVQVTYLGYPNTTGLSAIDYRLTDARVDPPGEADRLSAEQLIRLPHSYFCYRPLDSAPAVNPLPALAAGRVTFGCFNNFPKVSNAFLDAVARIMQRVPGSRLLLKAKPLAVAEVAHRVRRHFAGFGVDATRLDLRGWTPKVDGHLSIYQEVDIALDSFPYNGATTSCEALWMGVPVVSVLGNRHAARVGSSLLHAVDLENLVAEDVEQYIEIAAALAGDLEALAQLRAGLRERVRSSSLMDGAGFTRALEDNYLEFWRRAASASASATGEPDSSRESIQERLREASAQRAAGRSLQAEAAYTWILRRQPDHLEALTAVWDMAHEAADPGASVDWLSRGISVSPGVANLHYMLGCALQAQGRSMEAIASFGKAIEIDPGLAKAHNNLGCTLEAAGDVQAAVRCYRRAIDIDPRLAVVHYNLGNVYRQGRDDAQAIEHFRRALQWEPGHADWQCNLGQAHYNRLQLDEAEACYRKSIAIDAGDARAHAGLAAALSALGRVGEADACYRAAMEIDSDDAEVHDALLLNLHCLRGNEPAAMFEAHLEWAARHRPVGARGGYRSRSEVAIDDRRLNIAYVSPDFARHPVAQFIEPVLSAHDRSRFNIFCYSSVAYPDEATERIKGACENWRDISRLENLWVSQRMRADQIDILVDLAGHAQGGRLALFMRRPAPVQLSWLGYPNTTGLRDMDYRLTDAFADPLGETERFHTETLIRLENGFLCYQPPHDCPEIGELPSIASGGITFGCFGELARITPEMVELWSRLLGRVPGARLMLKADGLSAASARHALATRFAVHGVTGGQLMLLGGEDSTRGQLARYGEVDIALDVFPYHGLASTCEALWMGVPVIVLAGITHVARVGVSILNRAGLGDLVAHSPEEYLEKACALAAQLERRRQLRRELRDRLRRSALLDSAAVTRGIESAYREIWETFAAAQRAQDDDSTGRLSAS
ncbi:MAG: tetratricopeptide repeat protein, partial [Betaproteobacteria bacterium]|nr:tetratricopeptide repeat protein [Betaproteobacteria bacterium]